VREGCALVVKKRAPEGVPSLGGESEGGPVKEGWAEIVFDSDRRLVFVDSAENLEEILGAAGVREASAVRVGDIDRIEVEDEEGE